MNGKHFFFRHVVKSKLTGEQLRVLMCMLTTEMDGVVGIKQVEIADMLNLTESNVSRSIKALIDADLFSKQVEKGYDGRPIWKINPVFEKQATLLVNERYEKAHGKPFKPNW